MRLDSDIRRKTYSPPQLNKLTPEQARLLLIGHATCGDQGAKDLLDVLYPLAREEGNHAAPVYFKEKEPAKIKSRTSRLIRRALVAFHSTRENFHRFIRG